jgi:hypothetical protein
MEDILINRVEIEASEARMQDAVNNRKVYATGTIAEKIGGLVNLLLSIFRNDWYVDFQQQEYVRDATNPSKIFKIELKNQHSIYIENTGTGRIRIFNNKWLAPGEWWSDSNQHYRKYYRSIDLLLADNFNDAEGYITPSPGLLTHKCIVITKQVTSQP